MPGTNRLHVVRSGAFCNPPAPENDRNFPVFFGEIFLRKMYRFSKVFPEKFRIFFLRILLSFPGNFLKISGHITGILHGKIHTSPPAPVSFPLFSTFGFPSGTARGSPSLPISSSHESSTRKKRSEPARE